MPTYPAFLARRFAARGVPCTVDRIEDLSPRLRRVHLSGDGLRGHQWQPCQVTSLPVSEREFRHYPPDAFDSAAGSMSVLCYRHGAGHGPGRTAPGEAWLSGLEKGHAVAAIMPGAARSFRAIRATGRYRVFGDG